MTAVDTPVLVVMTGPPGAGKTTVAEAVRGRLGLPGRGAAVAGVDTTTFPDVGAVADAVARLLDR